MSALTCVLDVSGEDQLYGPTAHSGVLQAGGCPDRKIISENAVGEIRVGDGDSRRF